MNKLDKLQEKYEKTMKRRSDFSRVSKGNPFGWPKKKVKSKEKK